MLIGFTLSFLISCGADATGESKNKVKKLPYIGNHETVEKVVNGKKVVDTLYYEVPDFEYLDQDSNTIHKSDFKGKVLIVDFFFTSCSSICKPMTAQMKRLNENTSDLKESVQFISFSIDPEHDTPAVLKEYVKNRGLNTDNWKLLTGDEAKTHVLGCEGFLVHAARDDNDDDGYAHSEYFVLVDKEGHIRGHYAGTSPKDVDNLEKDLRFLIKTEYGVKTDK